MASINTDTLKMEYDRSRIESVLDADCDDQPLEGLDRLMLKMPVVLSMSRPRDRPVIVSCEKR